MESNYLLQNKYKKIGWLLLIVGLLGGIFMYATGFEPNEYIKVKVFSIYEDPIFGKSKFFTIVEKGIFDELVSILIIVGGLIVGFTKEKIEDEFIYKIRKDSLVWALIVNYIVLLVAVVFVYDITFLHVLFFNMFTPLIIFIIRFTVLKSKYLRHEE